MIDRICSYGGDCTNLKRKESYLGEKGREKVMVICYGLEKTGGKKGTRCQGKGGDYPPIKTRRKGDPTPSGKNIQG